MVRSWVDSIMAEKSALYFFLFCFIFTSTNNAHDLFYRPSIHLDLVEFVRSRFCLLTGNLIGYTVIRSRFCLLRGNSISYALHFMNPLSYFSCVNMLKKKSKKDKKRSWAIIFFFNFLFFTIFSCNPFLTLTHTSLVD